MLCCAGVLLLYVCVGAGFSSFVQQFSFTHLRAELKKLLLRVQKKIHTEPNRVRYTMNGFVAAMGSYVKALTDLALETAARIGPVIVNMDGTSCQVPDAAESIQKVQKRGAIGKKRMTSKC